MSLTPDQLREAADFLCKNTGLYFNDAAAKLRAEADRMDAATAEAKLNLAIGEHWATHMENKYKWCFPAATKRDKEKFGEAAFAAVKAHTLEVRISR